MTLRHKPYIAPENLLPYHQGKTRESYLLTNNLMAQVATDRVSTHNKVHISIIPHKGEILTMMTVFWLTEVLKDLPNHLVVWGRRIYDYLPAGLEEKYPDLHYRTIIVQQLDMAPREFVFRRYLAGSLLEAYQHGKDPYGINLPAGLQEMSEFKGLIFTPTEKTETDDPVDSVETKVKFPAESHLARVAFFEVEKFLREKGIVLVDSKEEIGRVGSGCAMLGDELFTPDSSRFVWLKDIKLGISPPWIDKQVVRDEAERVWAGGKKISLTFYPSIISKTANIYEGLLTHVTGRTRQDWRASFD